MQQEVLDTGQVVNVKFKKISWRSLQKGMLHQGLKVKKLNNFSNFNSVVRKLCRFSLQMIERHQAASKSRIFN